MKSHLLKVLAVVTLFLLPTINFGQLAPDLKSAGNFAILAGTAITSAIPASQINNLDVGLSPGFRSSITGFPPSTVVNGDIFAADDIAPPGVPAMLLQAKQDLLEAYLFAAAAYVPAPATVAGDQGGLTLAPGIYKSNSSLLIQSGNLTLDAQGNSNAVWIFQIATELVSIGGSPNPSPSGGNVILTNGALAKNVFWQVGTSATIGDYTDFKGNVMALISITANSGASVEGRLLALTGAVTLAGGLVMNEPDAGPVVVPEEFYISKTANPETFVAVNDVINYEIEVGNTGTGTLTDIVVTDDLTGSTWTITLTPGAFEILTTSYTITQSDLDNRSVINIATAEHGTIEVSAYNVILIEGPLPSAIPISSWALVLGGVLIAVFVLVRYRHIFW